MKEKIASLKQRLLELNDLRMAAALLSWDQSTYMPPGGAPARGRQIALLSRLAQERFVDPELGRLLDELQPYAESLPFEDDDASLVRVTRRQYERAIKVPPQLIAQVASHAADAYQLWIAARPANDFSRVEAALQRTLDLSRKVSSYFDYDHIADPLINFADEGMSAASVQALFADLRVQLVPLVEQVADIETDDSFLHRSFNVAQQRQFGEMIIKQYGYDFQRGRQDLTHHPFMTKFSLGDVRITTRFNENDLGDGLFSTLHEAGHALYEQGIAMKYEGSPLASGTSSGVHESQSRLWENLVGRSRTFWQHYYPQLQQAFPGQLDDVALDDFYRAINKVQRSLIRVDADEVTYNLHVMIRFDLELALLDGDLAVRDLPEAWHERYSADLGLHADNDSNGVLQDVHWYSGLIGGAFQGYTLGNVMSAAFFEKALAAHPEIESQLGNGQFDAIGCWLGDNIYRHGSKFTAPELIDRVLDEPLSIDPYIRYLKTKFGELYGLPA